MSSALRQIDRLPIAPLHTSLRDHPNCVLETDPTPGHLAQLALAHQRQQIMRSASRMVGRVAINSICHTMSRISGADEA